MIRNVLNRTAPVLLGAATVVKADGSNLTGEADAKSKQIICKPSELPLYRPINQQITCECEGHKKETLSKPEQLIEDGIRMVREQIFEASHLFTDQKNQAVQWYEDGKKQTKFIRDYLNEEDNTLPRVGAIVIGGISGLIFGLRRGFFRRLLYSSIGAGGVASVCYPQEAEMYAQHGLVEAKKYATIGYNFVYGVKPGDKQLELPTIPTSLDELKNSMTGFARSAYDAVFPDKK
ncbi:MICOS complex subunit MIC27 [Topomyia yanbarensis]|uniref:MICOS complex subunit MIC27 n=1 Tax=Topomyia yanbarensis TaxID=2498891 RepID=UPI00273C385B|nr:MICOS complex subunit MIC27 [Topomyia yanbarensis]XP_058821649.1 MICOS complex subunit MIC27 [Topomyia yanbarensis]